MRELICKALWYVLGWIFVITLIPPAIVIALAAVLVGPLEREDAAAS